MYSTVGRFCSVTCCAIDSIILKKTSGQAYVYMYGLIDYIAVSCTSSILPCLHMYTMLYLPTYCLLKDSPKRALFAIGVCSCSAKGTVSKYRREWVLKRLLCT